MKEKRKFYDYGHIMTSHHLGLSRMLNITVSFLHLVDENYGFIISSGEFNSKKITLKLAQQIKVVLIVVTEKFILNLSGFSWIYWVFCLGSIDIK